MDDQQVPEQGEDSSDTTTTEQPVSRPVTVPNVTPGAKSGLDHQVIGSDAQDAYDATAGDLDEDDDERGAIDGELEVDPASEVSGSVEQTDGPAGAAENADTGVVTQPGEPLPDAQSSPQDAGSGSVDGNADVPPVVSPAAEDAAQDAGSGDAGGDEAPSTS